MKSLSVIDQIHARAIEVSSRHKRTEAELIDVLQLVEEHRVFVKRGHASLFRYVVDDLGLSESTAYALITVARKSMQVPELKAQLQSGEITLSNARQIVSVLTPQNQAKWLSKASALSHRQLEKEVVKVRPKEATPERASYVSSDRVKLELGLSEREMLRLRRVQDLMSQARRRAMSLEEVIEAFNADYLRRHDPVEKAKRHRVRQAAPRPDAGLNADAGPKASASGAGARTKTSADANGNSEVDSNVSSVTNSKTVLTSPNSRQVQREAQSQAQSQTKIVKTLSTRRAQAIRQGREPIPAAILHQVNLRDQRRCAHLKRDGSRCNQSRWIEIHHKIPVSQGGPNTLDNLITLCSSHHQLMHLPDGF